MKFSNHVRFRKEEDFIFLCDCKNLKDFKVPLRYWDFLLKLQKGITALKLSSEESLLIEDFKKVKLLEG